MDAVHSTVPFLLLCREMAYLPFFTRTERNCHECGHRYFKDFFSLLFYNFCEAGCRRNPARSRNDGKIHGCNIHGFNPSCDAGRHFIENGTQNGRHLDGVACRMDGCCGFIHFVLPYRGVVSTGCPQAKCVAK